MPVLRRSHDHPGLVIEAQERGGEVLYQLSDEGERFLALVLGLHAGDSVRDKDLALLVDRGWATRIERPSPPAAASPSPRPASATPSSVGQRPAASRRTRGREVALQVLYLTEQNPEVDADEIERFIARRLRDAKLIDYTRELVAGVRARLADIDERISSVAENWRLDRMAAIDRNILRLGVYEMHNRSDVPVKVAINEALELAKRYSTAQSSRFVNGILDRLQNAPESPHPDDLSALTPPPFEENRGEGPNDDSTPAVGETPEQPRPDRIDPTPRLAPGSPPLASRGVVGRASSNLPQTTPPDTLCPKPDPDPLPPPDQTGQLADEASTIDDSPGEPPPVR